MIYNLKRKINKLREFLFSYSGIKIGGETTYTFEESMHPKVLQRLRQYLMTLGHSERELNKEGAVIYLTDKNST